MEKKIKSRAFKKNSMSLDKRFVVDAFIWSIENNKKLQVEGSMSKDVLEERNCVLGDLALRLGFWSLVEKHLDL